MSETFDTRQEAADYVLRCQGGSDDGDVPALTSLLRECCNYLLSDEQAEAAIRLSDSLIGRARAVLPEANEPAISRFEFEELVSASCGFLWEFPVLPVESLPCLLSACQESNDSRIQMCLQMLQNLSDEPHIRETPSM